MKIRTSIVILSAIFAANSQAALVAGFNFNNNTPGVSGALGTLNTTGTVEVFNPTGETLTPAANGLSSGSATINLSGIGGTQGGTANNNWGTFAGDLANAVSGDAAGGALAIVGSGNNGSTLIITISTAGYEDVVLSYSTRGTSTGFSTHTWDYSTDGTNFTNASTITGRNVTPWSTQLVDLSAITAVENQATVWFRLTVSGSTNATGNNRFDNIQVNAVPEPATALLGAFGLLGLLRRRR